MDAIERKFKIVVASIFRVPPNSIKNTTRFVEDLGARSLTMIELVATVESEFGISTTPKETAKNSTVAEAIAYIRKKLLEKRVK